MPTATNSRKAPHVRRSAANVQRPSRLVQSILTAPLGEDRGGNNPAGLICAANSSRFVQGTYHTALTTYATGYKDPQDLAALLEFISPKVPTARRFSFKKSINAEHFLSELDDIRATGSDFKRVEYTGDDQLGETLNKGLTMRVDDDEQLGDDWREFYTGLLKRRLLRNDIRRSLILMNSAGTLTPVYWNNAGEPDKDVRHACKRVAHGGNNYDGIGLRANRVLFSGDAWAARQDCYEAVEGNPSRYARADRTEEELARYLSTEEVVVSNALYQISSLEKANLIGDLMVFAFYAESGLSKDDPTAIKRFVSPTKQGSADFAVYVEEHPKFTDITVEHYSRNMVTAEAGIQRLQVAATV